MFKPTALILNSAALMACAIFYSPWRTIALISLMLFLPFLDKTWQPDKITYRKSSFMMWCILSTMIILITTVNSDHVVNNLYGIIFIAIPEEFFFRAYLTTQLQRCTLINIKHIKPEFIANTFASILFAIMHIPAQGWLGLLVFFPSIVFGYVYQQTHDLILVSLLHALMNMIFLTYLVQILF